MKKILLSLMGLLLLSQMALAQNFYGSGVQEVRLEIPYKNWDFKLDSIKKANPEARLAGTAFINGQRFDSVGIRFKGNSSYFRSRNDTYKKLPFNVKLDYKNKGNKLKDGHTSVKLSNAFLDPGFVREPLTYELIRNYMPAPQCNFSKVLINNTLYGLYVNSESVDELFIQKHFGSTKGFLVKCDPDNWKRVRSQTGCPKGENASLAYLNDNFGCYDAFYEVDDPGAWKPLLNLIKVLNKTPDKIETVLDVDQTLWMLAINNATVNLDSYNGSLSHNYYLWFDSVGVAHPIIWDLNMALGGWRRDFSFVEIADQQLIQYSPMAEFENPKRPLISKLLRVPLYRKIYLAHLKTIVQEQFKDGRFVSRAQAMMKEIDAPVKADTLKLYSYADFQNALDKTMKSGPDNIIGIKQLIAPRTEFLLKHPLLNKPEPTVSDIKVSKNEGKVTVTAKSSNAIGVWLFYRKDKQFAFGRTPMLDDGTNGDAKAGDGIYTVQIDAAILAHYYIAAESAEAAITFPARASMEYLKL